MPLAVITGANRGLGLEFTRQYLAAGWQVVTISRRRSAELEELQRGNALRIIDADLGDDRSLDAAVAGIDDEVVDLLINNAGMMGDGSFAESGLAYQAFGTFDRDEWHRVFDINVCTPMALTERLVHKLAAAEQGIVVTLSSMLGSNALNTAGNLYAYRVSKAAVNSLMRSMGINLRDRGIIGVALHPGWVRTQLGGPDAELDPAAAVRACIGVIDRLEARDSGRFFAYHGGEMPY
ncbi:MAG: SDR family oxidoreductase [Woeseiaceae bacterium]|nr:SDR family oxidoreductase [Woeseiaceae bacterium]